MTESNSLSPTFTLDKHYPLLRARLILFFQRRRCASPEDLADDTVTRLISHSADKRCDEVEKIAFGVAKNVFRESVRHSVRFVSLDSIRPVRDTSSSWGHRSREIAETLVRDLSAEDRELLEEYLLGGAKARELAIHLGLSESSVRGRVFKLRQQLRVAAGLAKTRSRRNPPASNIAA